MAEENGKTADDVELDDEAKELKLREIKAKSRKAIAEAEQPVGESKGRTGTVDTGEKGGASLVSVMAAERLSEAAASIAQKVAAATRDGWILIVEDRAVAENDVVYTEVTARLAAFETAFDKALESKNAVMDTLAVPLAAIVGFAQLGADLIAMFKADYKVSGRDVTVNRVALVAEVARNLLAKNRKVVLSGFGVVEQSKVLATFTRIAKKRYALDRWAAQEKNERVDPKLREIESTSAYMSELRTAKVKALGEGKTKEAESLGSEMKQAEETLKGLLTDPNLARARADISAASTLVAGFDSYAVALTTVPQGAKYAPIHAAALREQLRREFGVDSTDAKSKGALKLRAYVLYLEVTSAGGDTVTRSGAVFTDAKSAFLGAVQGTYLLASADGEMVASGAVTKFGGMTYELGKSFDDVIPAESNGHGVGTGKEPTRDFGRTAEEVQTTT
jgi:hypothetical protein